MNFKFIGKSYLSTMSSQTSIPVDLSFDENVEYILHFLILSGLLDSEDDLLFSRITEKDRVRTWINKFKGNKDHIPSCRGDTKTCDRCQATENLRSTRRIIDEINLLIPTKTKEELILIVLEIYLTTQPQRRFVSHQEFVTFLNGDYERRYNEIFDSIDSPSKRAIAWEYIDVAKKEQAKAMIESLHDYAVTCI